MQGLLSAFGSCRPCSGCRHCSGFDSSAVILPYCNQIIARGLVIVKSKLYRRLFCAAPLCPAIAIARHNRKKQKTAAAERSLPPLSFCVLMVCLRPNRLQKHLPHQPFKSPCAADTQSPAAIIKQNTGQGSFSLCPMLYARPCDHSR